MKQKRKGFYAKKRRLDLLLTVCLTMCLTMFMGCNEEQQTIHLDNNVPAPTQVEIIGVTFYTQADTGVFLLPRIESGRATFRLVTSAIGGTTNRIH
jgi:hypothetical protein